MSEFKEKLQGFIQHYNKLNALGEEAEDGFSSEFMLLKQESQQYKDSNTFPAEAGQQPFNKKKNRFKDILPYEYTRVQLHKSEGVEGSDYINANYIQGADGNVTYIAAQGPLPHTVDDFWRMLWYHQIEIVVMACKLVEVGRKKCEQYWPPLGESQMFGPIQVTMTNEESISNDFTVRELLAECQGESQVVRQYHYNAWPDHGRPSSAQPIIRMIERIGDHRKRRDIPVVVHCSAGCGRTGTIIAIDYVRAMLLAEDIGDGINVFSIVHEMRKQRPSMVQAKEQYVFVYEAVVEMITRILDNVPRAPPKQLKFEKKDSPPIATPSTSDGIYQNVTDMGINTDQRNSTGSLELPSPIKPTPPKPVSRTSSGGTPSVPTGGKPSPPAKPKPRPKPVPETPPKKPEATPKKTDTPPKGVPEPAPRRISNETTPVPSPRKPSPVPPMSSTPISSTTPSEGKGYVNVPNSGGSSTTPSQGKGYVNVPNSGGGVVVVNNETTYSVVNKTSTLPGKGKKNVSNTSIFDQLMTECGDVLSDKDKQEISGTSPLPPPPVETVGGSYSLLDSVNESDIPPDIPVMTMEASQLLIGEVPTNQQQPQDIGKASSIYETPDIVSMSVDPAPKSTSIAFSATLPPTSSKPLQENKRNSKTTSGLFTKKTKEKTRSTEDLKAPAHTQLTKTVSVGPTAGKRPQTMPPIKKDRASDKYHFPGEMGFGIRIGKPKGPRPIPSHWSIPNGLVH